MVMVIVIDVFGFNCLKNIVLFFDKGKLIVNWFLVWIILIWIGNWGKWVYCGCLFNELLGNFKWLRFNDVVLL